jgi:TP901 family phage tail tape measure protein
MGEFDFGIEAGVRGASQYINDIHKLERVTDESLDNMAKSTKKATGAWEEMTNMFPGLGRAAELARNPLVLLTAAITGLVLAFTTVVGSAEEFNNEFLQIQNLNIDKSAEQIDGLRDSILAASFATGKGAKEMSRAFFDIQSGTGLFGDEVDAIARKVADFSTATKVDFNTAIGASIKAIRAFKLEVDDLDGFLASSFATVQLGIVTFDQLSRVQTDFAGAAAGAGQNVDTANKIFAGFTATAKSAEEAATLTKTAFQDLGKKPTIDGLKSIGVSMYDASGAIRNTTDVVKDLVPKFKAMSQQRFDSLLAEIGGSEGLRGLLLQVRNEGEGLIEVFNNFDKAKENFDFDKLLENAKGDFTTLKEIVGNQLNTVFTQIGVKVLPILAQALNSVIKLLPVMLGFVSDNAEALKALGIAAGIVAGGILLAKSAIAAYNIIVAISAAVTAAYEATIITLQATYIALTGSATIAAGAIKAFQILMASNPYTLAIVAVAALATAIYLLSSRTKELTETEKINLDLSNRIAEEYGKQAGESQVLFDKLRTLDKKSVEYGETIKLINEQYGEYLPNLLDNKTSLEGIDAAQKAVNASLMEKIRLQIKDQKLTELASDFFGKAMKSQTELAKQTGISMGDLDTAIAELAQTGKQFSAEEFSGLLSDKLNSGQLRSTIAELAKLPGVSEETSKLLEKVSASGSRASVALLDLAFGTGQYQNQVDDVNKFFDSKDPFGKIKTDEEEAADAADGLTKSLKTLKAEVQPASGSIALYELELSRLEEKFKATGSAMERARLAERIKEVREEIDKMRNPKTQAEDPLDALAGMGAVNVSVDFGAPAVESLSMVELAMMGVQAQTEALKEKFKDLGKSIQHDLTNAFGEAFFKFGQMIGMGNKAGDAAKAALLGLADVVLSQVPKYIGLFLLETAVGLGFPAGVPFAIGGIALLAFSGLASGLLSKLGSASTEQAAAASATSAVPTSAAPLAQAAGTGLSNFNAGEFDNNRQIVKVYIGNKEVSNLIRQDILRELDLQGG